VALIKRFQFIVDRTLKPRALELLAKREDGTLPRPEDDLEMVETALEVISRLKEKGIPLTVHVNIYPSTLSKIWNLQALIKEIVRHRDRLVVEILESPALQQNEIEALRKVNSKTGLSFYLDDFGNGHANYLYLFGYNLPFAGIKVDATVVPPDVAAVLKQKFRVVAEKVRALTYPAHLFQAYEYHYPEPLEALLESLRERFPSSFSS
jgi:hypothetical protein